MHATYSISENIFQMKKAPKYLTGSIAKCSDITHCFICASPAPASGAQSSPRASIGRRQGGCVLSPVLTRNSSSPQTDDNSVASEHRNVSEPPVDSLDGRPNGSEMKDSGTTSTPQDRDSFDGSHNHANTGDSIDPTYIDQTADLPRQTADLPPPAQNADLHVVKGDTRKDRRPETTEVTVQPVGASLKHVPTILRRQRPHKFHCQRHQQQGQQHEKQTVDARVTSNLNKNGIDLKRERECESSPTCGVPEATCQPSGCSTDGNVSEDKLAGTVLTTQAVATVEESAIQYCDTKENTGPNNVEVSTTGATPKANFAVPSDPKTEHYNPKDAQMVNVKPRPKPATELSCSGRLLGDTSLTRNIVTLNKSRRTVPCKAIVGTTATVATASAKTFPGSKPNGHCRGIVGCPSKAPSSRPIVAATSHAGKDSTPKSPRCGVTKLTPNQRLAKGHHKVSTTALGERRALATDRYAMDDATYSIIAEKYRLFYRFVL